MLRALVLASLLVTTRVRAQDLASQALMPRDVALRAQLGAAAERERHRGWALPLMLVAGGGLVALGAALPTDFGGIGLPLGTLALFRGTMALALTDDARELPAQYAAIPALPDRVRFGEQRLERLARQHRRHRIADGIATLLLSAASVPLRYGFARLDDASYQFGASYVDYVLVTLAALGVTEGTLTLFDETPAEAAWARYQRPPDERRPLAGRDFLHARIAF
jgi:hypothetical protein